MTHRREHGFTLLELMVVLVIIGTLLTLATLSLDRDHAGETLETEGRRLAALLELASEEAIISSSELGLQFTSDRYRFLRRNTEQWQPFEGDPLLRERTLPEGVEPTLILEGLEVALEESDEPTPQLLLLSSGEITPFHLTLRHRESEAWFELTADALGRLSLQRGEE